MTHFTSTAKPITRRDLALTLWGGALVLLGFLVAYALHRWSADPPRMGRAIFSPWLDNLSTLGWTRDPMGQDNRPAALVFALTLTGTGLLFLHFWSWRRRLVKPAGLRRAVGLCGGLMGLFLLLVGLLPENLFPRLHNGMIFPPVLLGALAILGCYLGPDPGLESRRARRVTQGVIAVAFLTAVALKGAVLLEWLPRQPALPVMQKILILLLGAWTLRQAAILRRAMGRPRP
ncbi:MAG: hypothetical protein K9N49_03140 [Candidatus Marinimicrobia bacterium]|nr:hypothetical protein [Candidatus Neomarinimicrobiota bacterium]